jgi:hypothetical protein
MRAGVLTHVAGQRTAGDSGDGGPPSQAQFNGPHNLAVLPDGDVLIGDTWNGRVRRVSRHRHRFDPARLHRSAAKARNAGPYCITLDFTGTQLYVADLRRVSTPSIWPREARVVAGNGQKGVPDRRRRRHRAPLVDPRAAVARPPRQPLHPRTRRPRPARGR